MSLGVSERLLSDGWVGSEGRGHLAPLFLVCVNTHAHTCTYSHSDPPHLHKEISTEMTAEHKHSKTKAQATRFSSLLVCGESPTSLLPVSLLTLSDMGTGQLGGVRTLPLEITW